MNGQWKVQPESKDTLWDVALFAILGSMSLKQVWLNTAVLHIWFQINCPWNFQPEFKDTLWDKTLFAFSQTMSLKTGSTVVALKVLNCNNYVWKYSLSYDIFEKKWKSKK